MSPNDPVFLTRADEKTVALDGSATVVEIRPNFLYYYESYDVAQSPLEEACARGDVYVRAPIPFL